MQLCIKKPAVSSGVVPQELSTFVFASVSLTDRKFSDFARLAGQQAPGSSSLPLPSAGISSGYCHTWLFNVGSEARPQVFLILEKQALCELSHLLAYH